MAVCAFCNQYISTKDPQKTYRGRKYHLVCMDKMIDDADSGDNDKEKLKNYICKLYGIQGLSSLIENQIDEFVNQKSFTLSGIHASLYYFFELQNNPVTEQVRGIGIVPFVYEEAKTFFKTKNEALSANQSYEPQITKKTIKIIPKDTSVTKIDIGSL